MGGRVRVPRRRGLPDGAAAQGVARGAARETRRARLVQTIHLLRSGAHDGDGHQAGARSHSGAHPRQGYDPSRLRSGCVAHAADRAGPAARAPGGAGGCEAHRVSRRGGRGPRRRRPRRRAPAAARRRGTSRSRSPTASRRPRVARRQRHAIGERPGWPTRGATRG